MTTIPASFRAIATAHDPEARARHSRWLGMLSNGDWTRIRAVARMLNPAYMPPALVDLEAPLRISVCPAGQEKRFSGERVGTLRGGQVAVLVSEKSGA